MRGRRRKAPSLLDQAYVQGRVLLFALSPSAGGGRSAVPAWDPSRLEEQAGSGWSRRDHHPDHSPSAARRHGPACHGGGAPSQGVLRTNSRGRRRLPHRTAGGLPSCRRALSALAAVSWISGSGDGRRWGARGWRASARDPPSPASRRRGRIALSWTEPGAPGKAQPLPRPLPGLPAGIQQISIPPADGGVRHVPP